jgi:hypothetical protein
VFGILKLGRVLRLNKIIQFLKSANDIKASLKIFKMVLFLTVYLHIYSCYWWSIVSQTETWVPNEDSMHGDDKYYKIYNKDQFTRQYLTSLHWVVLITLGTDVSPQDTYQTVVSSTGMFLGAIINANIFGELALIFSQLDKDTKEF